MSHITTQRSRRFRLALAFAIAALAVLSIAESLAQKPPRGSGWDYWEPGWMHRRMWGPQSMRPDMRARMERHWTYMHVGIPPAYEGVRSSVKWTPENLAEGGKLYAQHCASCHGKTGLGDGEAGKSLTPSPALLAYLIQRPMAADEYLLWTISDGGKAFGTDMPAFKDTLKRDEIWRIIAYMRNGFTPVEK